MGIFDFIFGTKKTQINKFLEKDAVILDVRTTNEWKNGHIDNAVHIPLKELNKRLDEVKQMNKPIITCCASGVRSAKAAKFLNLNNIEATNGGSWIRLMKKL